MIAHVGLAALWGAAMLAALELLFSMRTAEAGDRALCVVRVVLTTVALLAFFAEFADSLGAALSELPGQLLLGSALLGGATLVQVRFDQEAEAKSSRRAARLQAVLAFLSLLILLFALHPFAPIANVPVSERLELTALVFGIVGLAMATTIGVGALSTNTISRTTARTMRSWTLAAWIALTLANLVAAEALGAIRLLVPWLAATALLHALSVVARGRLLRLHLPLWPGLVPAVGVTVLALVISVLAAPTIGVIERLALVLGFALIPASLTPLFLRPLRRLSLVSVGTAVAHLGFALALIGASWSASFREERTLVMHPGDTAPIGPWMIHFVDLLPAAGPGFTALEAHLEASSGEGLLPLLPQNRYGKRSTAPYRQDATIDQAAGELSASLEGARASDSVRLTLSWRPLRSMMWIGGLVMTAGGLLTLIGRALAARRRRREADDIHSSREWR